MPYFSVFVPGSHRFVFYSSLLLTGIFGLLSSGCNDSSSSVTRDVHTTRCITDVSASDRHEFQCDGVQFKVLLTQECIDRACGLIFDVHGWLSNPDQQEGRSNLARAAQEKGGYIVVQPGELSVPSSWKPEVHYDVVFEFMQQSIAAYAVDRDRVHFTGFSQGGFMTWKFICDHADIIASAAPLSAPEVGCFLTGNGPSRKVPIFFISGTQDLLIRYYNAPNTLSVTDTLVSVMYDYELVTADADAYVFSPAGDIVVDDAGKIDVAAANVRFEIVDGSQDGSYLWTRYTDATGIPFEHLRHSNGHVYPDNPDSLIFPEDPSVWFSIGDAILAFFVQNPRR